MINKLKSIIEEQKLFKPKDKLLLAFSGGIDSTVLFILLLKLKIKFSVAHVNYKLRGKESDEDENFVKKMCSKNNIEVFVKKIENINEINLLKKNVQTNARKLRYDWFDFLKKEHQFDCVLTAHHALDQVETILHNQIRGTGVKGLIGMKPINGYLIRPLLSFTKNEIELFATKHKIKFRTDSSNLKNDYTRNKIRNLILPKFYSLNENIENTFFENSLKTLEFYEFAKENFENNLKNWVDRNGDTQLIFYSKNNSKFKHLHYYWLFENDGITIEQAKELIKFEKSKTGSFIKIGETLIFKRENSFESYLGSKIELFEKIRKGQKNLRVKTELITFEWIKLKDNIDFKLIKNDKDSIYIDVSSCKKFILRSWKAGDKMKPLGTDFYKKISDIFINKKLSSKTKAQSYIIEIDNKIAGFLPNVVSEDFKITDKTKYILKIMI